MFIANATVLRRGPHEFHALKTEATAEAMSDHIYLW